MPTRVKKRTKIPTKIVVKCQWSGARLLADTTLTPSSTISSVISSISSSLPSAILANKESLIVIYMRSSVPEKDWDEVTVQDLVGDCDGNILLTLNTQLSSPVNDVNAPTTLNTQLSSPINDVKATTSRVKSTSVKRQITPIESLKLLLDSNFDSSTKECLEVILKIVDNILTKPHDTKVRTLRLSNPAIQKKIVQKKGGLDVLLSIGFEYDLRSNAFNSNPEHVTLNRNKEDIALISTMRNRLVHVLTNDLGVSMKDIPPLRRPNAGGEKIETNFDVFKSHAINTQAVARGATDLTSNLPDEIPRGVMGKTEKQLEQLKKRQDDMERKFRSEFKDRQLLAMLPATSTSTSIMFANSQEDNSSRGDGSLLAAQMKKREDERKRKEEGLDGFKTKNMRDLEMMQKKKVYSHAQIKINFADGSSLSAKFLPSESVLTIKEEVRSAFIPELRSKLDFDLYITPPKHILEDRKSLIEEGLVPAARLHVSWKQGKSPQADISNPGSFIMKHLFQDTAGSAAHTTEHFPQSTKVVQDRKERTDVEEKGKDTKSSSATSSREEELMRRMLGKKKGLRR